MLMARSQERLVIACLRCQLLLAVCTLPNMTVKNVIVQMSLGWAFSQVNFFLFSKNRTNLWLIPTNFTKYVLVDKVLSHWTSYIAIVTVV
jgi:hypothetical protein